ncbi:allyl alcohol dehydrogenase-like protein [Tasmannia lanceolata]|uniref:allyl alcohol dehydrogenase-like protein n=1 Tax=Tasmannia lanceolata TaxID=3420 RepID=UPI0040631E6F
MGLLSWWKGKEAPATTKKQSTDTKPNISAGNSAAGTEIPGMNGAMEVPRPADATVFEFGSAAASADKVTLAGYCPVSDELEPCRWEILPSTGTEAPQFRVVF